MPTLQHAHTDHGTSETIGRNNDTAKKRRRPNADATTSPTSAAATTHITAWPGLADPAGGCP